MKPRHGGSPLPFDVVLAMAVIFLSIGMMVATWY